MRLAAFGIFSSLIASRSLWPRTPCSRARKGRLDRPDEARAWKRFDAGWIITSAEGIKLDPQNEKRLQAAKVKDGAVWLNGEKGRLPNLITREAFGDCEVHVEFLIAKRSNAGIKFHEVYEIQILDSFGKKDVDGTDMGGVYPRGIGARAATSIAVSLRRSTRQSRPGNGIRSMSSGGRRESMRRARRPPARARQGDAQRAGDPRQRRGENADRRELGAEGNRPGLLHAPVRSRPDGLAKRADQAGPVTAPAFSQARVWSDSSPKSPRSATDIDEIHPPFTMGRGSNLLPGESRGGYDPSEKVFDNSTQSRRPQPWLVSGGTGILACPQGGKQAGMPAPPRRSNTPAIWPCISTNPARSYALRGHRDCGGCENEGFPRGLFVSGSGHVYPPSR